MQIYYPYIVVTGVVIYFNILNFNALRHSRTLPIHYEWALATVLILFAGLFETGPDIEVYKEMFADVQASTGSNLFHSVSQGRDILYGLLLVVVAALGLGNSTVFLISAALSIGIKVAAFRYAFGSSILGLGLYFSSFYFLHDFTQIRLAIALAFCFLALLVLIKGKRFLYFLFCMLAVGFQAQTILFFIATVVLLTNLKYKYALVVLSIVMAGLLFSSVNFVLNLDMIANRTGANNGLVGIRLTAITFIIVNAAIIATAYLGSIGGFKNLYDQEIAQVSALLYCGGVLFFCITIASSDVLAWRVYEMFSSFGVFILITALRSTPNKISYLAGLSYFVLNLMVYFRSDLLLKHSIHNSFEALHVIFQ